MYDSRPEGTQAYELTLDYLNPESSPEYNPDQIRRKRVRTGDPESGQMAVVEMEIVPQAIQVSRRERRITFTGQLATLGMQ